MKKTSKNNARDFYITSVIDVKLCCNVINDLSFVKNYNNYNK